MKKQISTLIGPELDYAVAVAEGRERKHEIKECEDPFYSYCRICGLGNRDWKLEETVCTKDPDYSTNPAHGQPIFDRERIMLVPIEAEYRGARASFPDLKNYWVAHDAPYYYDEPGIEGPTSLVAGLRCFCISRLGEWIEIAEAEFEKTCRIDKALYVTRESAKENFLAGAAWQASRAQQEPPLPAPEQPELLHAFDRFVQRVVIELREAGISVGAGGGVGGDPNSPYNTTQVVVNAIRKFAEENKASRAAVPEEAMKDAARWNFFASAPQTALMLGSKHDPNDANFPWRDECDRLADLAMAPPAPKEKT